MIIGDLARHQAENTFLCTRSVLTPNIANQEWFEIHIIPKIVLLVSTEATDNRKELFKSTSQLTIPTKDVIAEEQLSY